jgi:hypothetical protein
MIDIVISVALAYLVLIYLMGACHNKDLLWPIKSESWVDVNGVDLAAIMSPIIVLVVLSVAIGTHSLLQ